LPSRWVVGSRKQRSRDLLGRRNECPQLLRGDVREIELLHTQEHPWFGTGRTGKNCMPRQPERHHVLDPVGIQQLRHKRCRFSASRSKPIHDCVGQRLSSHIAKLVQQHCTARVGCPREHFLGRHIFG
jgi:hypothetical protein